MAMAKVDNEIKGRLALITGASGGYVSVLKNDKKEELLANTPARSIASGPPVPAPCGPRAPLWR